MAMITNIQHFLGENGEVPELPPEAMELLRYLSAIIEAATIEYARPITFADTKCRSVINGKSCPKDIEVWVYAENNQIGWECLECGEEGVITNWGGTPYITCTVRVAFAW